MMRTVPYMVFNFRHGAGKPKSPYRTAFVFYDTIERKPYLLPDPKDEHEKMDQLGHPIRHLNRAILLGTTTIDLKNPDDFVHSKTVKKWLSGHFDGPLKLFDDGPVLLVNHEGYLPVDHKGVYYSRLKDREWQRYNRAHIEMTTRPHRSCYVRRPRSFYDSWLHGLVEPSFNVITPQTWAIGKFPQKFGFRLVTWGRSHRFFIREVELECNPDEGFMEPTMAFITRWEWANEQGTNVRRRGPYPVTFKFEGPVGCTIEEQRIRTPKQLYSFMNEFIG